MTNKSSGPKPIKSAQMQLEDKSLHRLEDLFSTDHFQIRVESRRDAGLDLTIEIADTEFTNWRLNVQLKAVEKTKKKKDGTVSKKIRTSNIRYMNSGPLLGAYILWVKETDIMYFEWVDEFHNTLQRSVPDWWKQKSNTLHFSKELTPENIARISDRIERHARIHEHLRAGKKIEQAIESFHDESSEIAIADAEESLVKLIDTFEGLSVIRPEFLVKFPPFSRSKNSKSSFDENGRTIETDNPFVINFFNDLIVKNNAVSSKSGKALDQKRMIKILYFLEQNLIHHIRSTDEFKEQRVCIHKLYLMHENCHCEKCSYRRLQWDKALTMLGSDFDKNDPYNWLRRGYVLLEVGKVREAFLLYQELAAYSREQKNTVTYIVSRYCLVSMSFFIENRYYGEDQQAMLDEVQSIDLRNEIYFLCADGQLKLELVSILLGLLDDQHFHELYVDIDLIHRKIVSSYNADQRGGIVTSLDDYQSIASCVTSTTVYSEGNAFHWIYFNGFSLATEKLLEGALMLYSIQNPISKRLEYFDNYLVHVFLMYGRPDEFNRVLFRQGIKSIDFKPRHDEGTSKFFEYIDNFISSFNIAEIFSSTEQEKDNFIPSEILDQQLRKISILISLIADASIINQYTLSLINLLKQIKIDRRPKSLIGLRDIFIRSSDRLFVETFIECYKWLILSDAVDTRALSVEMPYFIIEKSSTYIDSDPETQNAILNRLNLEDAPARTRASVILAYYEIATDEIKEKISAYIQQTLRKSFDTSTCYSGALRGIVDFHDFIEQFKTKVPIRQMTKEARQSLGIKDFRNSSLTQFIHLCYKLKIDLSHPSIQVLHGEIEYYKWLMNLGTYDYADFNPYWLLHELPNDFIIEFQKYPAIKARVKEYLTKRQNHRLSEFYIKHLD